MSIQIRVVGIVASAIIASAASSQTAVEWKVSDGGNGHWYKIIERPYGIYEWGAARRAAQALGGDLAVFPSSSSWAFVRGICQSYSFTQYLAGGYRHAGSSEQWRWINGQVFEFFAWNSGVPNNGTGSDLVLCVGKGFAGLDGWDDWYPTDYSSGYVVEWSADCNGDGIVDYGQILRGELIDLNTNGVPDICETSVSSVIPPSVPSQGGSTITIRGNGFQTNPTVRIGGAPATNIVRVSLTEITATSPALLPGMASVQVNDFTLQDGIYIRPECGSDLDQNGSVDTGDIAIILLDFGPCYEPPAALTAPALTPLLVPDESTPASTPPAPQSARPTPQPRGTAS
jgi:hypothetical protein